MKVARDKYGTKLKYPNRSCIDCAKYPCFDGITKCISDFAKIGCKLWSNGNKS